MALICNECRVTGKTRKIMCRNTGEPCFFMRFCAVSGKYYQTDAAGKCKLKGKDDGEQQKNETDAINSI